MPINCDDPPPAQVRTAFGVDAEPTPLAGGQRTVWRVGRAVLKRLDCAPELLEWQENVLVALDGRRDFRVAPPLRSRTGELVVDGWTAWRHEPGEYRPGRWVDVLDVGGAFHRAVAGLVRPDLLDRRSDVWSLADRLAWDELTWDELTWDGVASGEVASGEVASGDVASSVALSGEVPDELIRGLLAARAPIAATAQLVHGDLTGNVLFADGLAPLVIDFSPYWRPPTYAAAIVVVDALVFEGADSSLVEYCADQRDFDQYLLRALIFRAVTERLSRRRRADVADPYGAVAELVLDRLAQ